MKFSKLNIVSIISWLQILGGIAGLVVIANLLLQTEEEDLTLCEVVKIQFF